MSPSTAAGHEPLPAASSGALSRAPAASASRLQVIAGFAVIYVVWGSTYLAIAYAVKSLPAVLTTGARFSVAGVLLCGWALVCGAPLPTWRQWRAAAIAGALLLVGGTASVSWAERTVPSGLASLLAATVPLWFVLLEWAAPGGRRPSGLVIAGIVLGLCGLVVLTAPGAVGGVAADAIAPAVVLTVGSILWAVGSLYSRHASLPTSATLAMGVQMLAGGLLCIPVGLALGESAFIDVARVSTASWIAVAYLTVVGCLVAFTTYLWLLRVSTPSRVATHAYVNPLVAVGLGWLVAGEPVHSRSVVAAGLIIGAVILITSGHRAGAADVDHPTLATEPS